MTNIDTPSCLSVSELNRLVKECLEVNFPAIWLEGEVSNFKHYPSGHMYFKLKDAKAQVNCVFFAGANRLCRFTMTDGLHIRVRAKISLYPERGDFQLIIELAEAAGDGALRLAFEQLQAKLRQEGLFDAARKRPLPPFPKSVGLITSTQGAVVRDMVTTLKRRFPAIGIIIYPAQVQGIAAVPSLLNALMLANQRQECDVLIIARGGGSLEDLQAFNDEQVARAIAASTLPIVSAVGHETDVTIADFVADLRAPTPTAAAELVSPHVDDYLQQIKHIHHRLLRIFVQQLEKWQMQYKHLQTRLKHPGQRLAEQSQQLDHQWQRLGQAWQLASHRWQLNVNQLEHGLFRLSPMHQLAQVKQLVVKQQLQLIHAIKHLQERYQLTLAAKASELEALSPLQTLARGYSITSDATSGKVVTQSNTVQSGQLLNIRLSDGGLLCQVLNHLDAQRTQDSSK